MTVDLLFSMAELVGTAAFAVSGAMVAVKKQLDIFGILLLSVITALGGGAIRDLLLGHTPPRMFYSAHLVLLALLCALAVFLFVRVTHSLNLWVGSRMDMLLTLSDALGLGIFAVIGTQAGISAGYGNNAFFCIVLGMITGVGGGVLRDMMCADIPFVLRKHVYAVAAILGGGCFYLLTTLGLDSGYASLLGMSATVVLRILAWHYRWNLPRAMVPDTKAKTI
jgi:uncharacterized membrane protein YeiH